MVRTLRFRAERLQFRGGRRRVRFEVAGLEPRLLMTLTIELRYDLDANNFFNTQAKKDVLQLAANNIASRLSDSLAAIQASGTNHWSADFFNPATGAMQSVNDLVIPANTIVVYVGGRALSGSERGFGGPGGYSWTGSTAWGNVVEGRGQAGALASIPTDTSPWGGAIAFDSRANWFFGQTTSGLSALQTDFLSVAEHELGHVLGLGDNPVGGPATSWSRYVVNNSFIGPNATAADGNTPVPLAPGGDHWAAGTQSGGQEAAMTPVLTDGTRKLFTPLDFAGLVDVGWTLQPTSTITFSASTYSVPETGGSATVTISRSSATNIAFVHVFTGGGTATPGQDYSSVSTDLYFAQGELTKTLRIPILDDNKAEGIETFGVALIDEVGVAPGAVTIAVVTIVDNERVKNGVSDFNGDGITDIAIFRPSQARWYSNLSGGGILNTVMGETNLFDIPVPGDYDGDGKTDLAVFRPSTGQWIAILSSGGLMIQSFGTPNLFDIPVPGDYDGDGKTDLAVFRPSQNRWIARLSGGGLMNVQFGEPNLIDIPVPGDYDGDGKTDLAVYRPSQNRWIALYSGNGGVMNLQFGVPNLVDIPIPGDYDGDGKTDIAVYRPSQSRWLVWLSRTGGLLNQQYGTANLFDVPTDAPFGSLMVLGVLRPGMTASSVSTSSVSTSSITAGTHAAAAFADVSVPAPAVAHKGVSMSLNINVRTRPRMASIAKSYRIE